MCLHSKASSVWLRPSLYAVAILLGIFAGWFELPVLSEAGTILATLFIKIFRCISLPIIALSIIVTLSSYFSEATLKPMWQRIIGYTLGTTWVAAFTAASLYLLIRPHNAHGLSVAAAPPPPNAQISYAEHLFNLIPNNLFSPFLEQQITGVLLVGIVFGLAVRAIPDPDARKTVTAFFKGLHGIFLAITTWVVRIIPLGLFGFITTTVLQLRHGMSLSGIGKYLAVVVLANLVQGLAILPGWLRWNGIPAYSALQKMLPALSVAFFSKSSAGTLPVTMDTIEKNLGVDSKISRLVLPLCTSINMNGCAAFIFTTVIYLMQNHGLSLSWSTMLLWTFIATIAAVGNAGIPMGCFFLSTSLLASMNIPLGLMGVILPFYSLIDMLETALNVWSDSCVTLVTDKKSKL